MVKHVIKGQKIDKIWGDLAECRAFPSRENISDDEWEILKIHLEAAYDAGYSEGLDQGAEDAEWNRSAMNGFDGRSPDDDEEESPESVYIRHAEAALKPKPTT
jgi:hypothetical protein